MKNKSYDYIFGNGKFNTWFNIIVSIISCSAISFCLTELLFSFDFKVSFQKALIFTILFVIFLLLFYYFIKQRTYKLFDQKITYGFRERKIVPLLGRHRKRAFCYLKKKFVKKFLENIVEASAELKYRQFVKQPTEADNLQRRKYSRLKQP